MIFDDVDPREQTIKEYFCRGRHNNCNMINLNQNLFSLHRQNVLNQYRDFFNDFELSYKDFCKICYKVWREPDNYIVFDMSKNKNINDKLRINWDRSFIV